MQITLRQARRLAEKSQKEMADLLHIHAQTYRKLELNPDLATIQQAKIISKIVGVSYDDIFFGHHSSLTREKMQSSA